MDDEFGHRRPTTGSSVCSVAANQIPDVQFDVPTLLVARGEYKIRGMRPEGTSCSECANGRATQRNEALRIGWRFTCRPQATQKRVRSYAKSSRASMLFLELCRGKIGRVSQPARTIYLSRFRTTDVTGCKCPWNSLGVAAPKGRPSRSSLMLSTRSADTARRVRRPDDHFCPRADGRQNLDGALRACLRPMPTHDPEGQAPVDDGAIGW